MTGEILVAAPHVMARYDRLWLTARARPRRDAGWHRTGDVGHLDDEGRLWVEGRLAHVVTTPRGVLTPVGLERAPRRSTGVGRAAAVGVGPRGRRSRSCSSSRPGRPRTAPGSRTSS